MTDRINTYNIQSSNKSEALDYLLGQYSSDTRREWGVRMIADSCFYFTFTEGEKTIPLPSHYPFTFRDDDGVHSVSSEEDKVTVNGITQFTILFKRA